MTVTLYDEFWNVVRSIETLDDEDIGAVTFHDGRVFVHREVDKFVEVRVYDADAGRML